MKYSLFWARVPVETIKSSSFCSSKKWTKMPHKQQDYFSIETDNIIFSGQCQRCFDPHWNNSKYNNLNSALLILLFTETSVSTSRDTASKDTNDISTGTCACALRHLQTYGLLSSPQYWTKMTELPPASTDKSIRENDLFVFLMPCR